jgi:hypothetical protein
VNPDPDFLPDSVLDPDQSTFRMLKGTVGSVTCFRKNCGATTPKKAFSKHFFVFSIFSRMH